MSGLWETMSAVQTTPEKNYFVGNRLYKGRWREFKNPPLKKKRCWGRRSWPIRLKIKHSGISVFILHAELCKQGITRIAKRLCSTFSGNWKSVGRVGGENTRWKKNPWLGNILFAANSNRCTQSENTHLHTEIHFHTYRHTRATHTYTYTHIYIHTL